jgi:hypothetical protein
MTSTFGSRRIGIAVGVVAVVAVAVGLALANQADSTPPKAKASTSPRPSGPMLGPNPTVGTQTFHLAWADRVSVPPPVQGRIRLKDGRSVGFAYGGAQQQGGRSVAQIRVDVGSARPQWFTLGPGTTQAVAGIPVTMKVVRLNPGAAGESNAQRTDTVDLEVTVTP